MKTIAGATGNRLTARWVQLLAGLFGIGIAVPLMIRSGLGLGPWDAFHVGIHHLTGISIGTASVLVGVAVVLGSLGLGILPGPGTLVNMVLIGVFIDLVLPWVPDAGGWGAGLAFYGLGIVVAGFATGMYMAAGLGSGPRDGLMVGLASRTGWPVRSVRTSIELAVLAAGWSMGSRIGIGTLLFAFLIGPAVQVGLQLFGALPPSALDEAPNSGRTNRLLRRRIA